ncbi:MAG: M1 family metallopeptidase [Bernardetiaceae bacterium]|nr:M1 family metallopeptidase [Bernardetiaceae bacterium]
MNRHTINFAYWILIITLLCTLNSCKTGEKKVQQALAESSENQVPTREKIVGFEPEEEKPEWLSPPSPYRPAYERHFELLNTRLDLSFDFEKQQVRSNALLTMRPYFYPQDRIKLDAKAMDIYRVLLLKDKQTDSLRYAYDGVTLEILLDTIYDKEQVIQISIDYTSKPKRAMDELQSDEIKEQGLYFINPTGYYPKRPTQVWTQGETEDNSVWFPTFDKPNIKTSLDIYLTVPDSFITISNGRLVSSEKNGNGLRRDYWKQEKPHAPYLTAIVIGDFAHIQKKTSSGLPLSYYVEPEYAEVAEAVFAETPQMIDYFSELLDFPFPWDKYAQVVVRDFVSGAMENTSISIFNESLQVESRQALSDYNYEGIIAHELAHQWFGNVVTCESWANLPLNEGFAKYFEYLWQAHRHGEREAEIERFDARNAYFYEAMFKREPAIRYHYADRDDMFDSHSYAKSALILHLLRHEIGDEAFFASLRYYLKKHAYSSVEIHDLRLAFEHITGRDLKRFFDQWFLQRGHPELQMSYTFSDNQIQVRIQQLQDSRYTPIYELNTQIFYQIGDKQYHQPIQIKGDSAYFSFEAAAMPDYVILDPYRLLPAYIDETHDLRAYLAMSQLDDYYLLQQEAISQLSSYVGDERVRTQLSALLGHEFWAIRENAMRSLGEYKGQDLDNYLAQIKGLAFSDPNSTVRASAVDIVASLRYDSDFLAQTMKDSSYYVKSNTIFAYLNQEGEEALDKIEPLEGEMERHIVYSLADFYSSLGIPNKLDWFTQTLDTKSGRELSFLLSLLTQYLINQPVDVKQKGLDYLADLAQHHSYFQVRKDAYQALIVIILNQDEIEYDLTPIREQETDRRVIEFQRALE